MKELVLKLTPDELEALLNLYDAGRGAYPQAFPPLYGEKHACLSLAKKMEDIEKKIHTIHTEELPF